MSKSNFINIIKIIIVAVVFSGALIFALNLKNGRNSNEIIEEMILYYGQYENQADDKVGELIAELKNVNRRQGAKWEKIMSTWKSVNTQIRINEGEIPDGMAKTSELCLVALGFQLNPDGSMKDELIERLKVVKTCAQKYPKAYIVCTGGGTASQDKSATEAGKMAEWLIDQGIDSGRIIVEDKSLTTAQNAQFTYDILSKKYPNIKLLAIVSSDYHIATGTLLFAAEATLRAPKVGDEKMVVITNAAWHAPKGNLSTMFQAGALIELSGDRETAYNIYSGNYDTKDLPQMETE